MYQYKVLRTFRKFYSIPDKRLNYYFWLLGNGNDGLCFNERLNIMVFFHLYIVFIVLSPSAYHTFIFDENGRIFCVGSHF